MQGSPPYPYSRIAAVLPFASAAGESGGFPFLNFESGHPHELLHIGRKRVGIGEVDHSKSRRVSAFALTCTSGKSGQEPRNFRNRATFFFIAEGSRIISPESIFSIVRVPLFNRNSFGMRTAWEFPFLNTLVVNFISTCVLCIRQILVVEPDQNGAKITVINCMSGLGRLRPQAAFLQQHKVPVGSSLASDNPGIAVPFKSDHLLPVTSVQSETFQ